MATFRSLLIVLSQFRGIRLLDSAAAKAIIKMNFSTDDSQCLCNRIRSLLSSVVVVGLLSLAACSGSDLNSPPQPASSPVPTPVPSSYSLTVTLSGAGTVTSAPVGIDCGSDCSEDYRRSTNVTLTATPDINQQFNGWAGACSGMQNTCTVSMTETRSLTATFVPRPASQFTLTVSVNGGGTITSAPGGINCGVDCTHNYPDGSNLTLTATAETGYQFSSWSGACTGSGTCVVTMGANRAVTATFTNGTARVLFEELFNNYSTYSPGIHVTEGARAEHSTGWNGDGAVKMYLGTPSDPTWAHYSGWYRPTVDESSFQSDRIHVRWCAQFGPGLFQSLGDGGKLLIVHRIVTNRDINPRVMAHIHNYSSTGRQIYSDNNIDNGPPRSPVFTLDDKAQQWMCFEIGVSQLNNTREFWATLQGGPEVLLETGTLNRTDGIWSAGAEFGYWGPVSNVNADAWWKLDELVISNTKIGPPPGFAAP